MPKYWEIIADNLSKAGWSWGSVSILDCRRRTISLLMRITATVSDTELQKFADLQTCQYLFTPLVD